MKESCCLVGMKLKFYQMMLFHLIYILGGVDNSSPSKSILEFDPEKEEWQKIGSMKEARWGLGMTVVTFADYAAWCN